MPPGSLISSREGAVYGFHKKTADNVTKQEQVGTVRLALGRLLVYTLEKFSTPGVAMFFSPQRLPVSWTSVCIALIGTGYCALQVAPLPVSLPCPGNGCVLFQDFTVYGVSLWWVGAAYFAVMAFLCLRRFYDLASLAAGAALVADAFLLAVMLVTASCVSCLGAGVLIALLFLVLRRHGQPKTYNQKPSCLLFAWSGLFFAALIFAGTETLGPWQLDGPRNAERRVYFAPSCPACRDAVTVFAGSAAFIPSAENSDDHAAIYGMQKALAEGKTMVQALDSVMAALRNGTLAKPSFPESFILRIKLARNKAEIMRMGFTQLPLIIINGMPQSLRPGNPGSPAPQRPASTGSSSASTTSSGYGSGLPPELTAPVDSCGNGSPVPCDPPN